jgi:two-component system CheB/CheR fusion protein
MNSTGPDNGEAISAAREAQQVVDDDRPGNSPFPIVGIGASAGGLEAFSQLLAHLPDNTGMAFVLVQHLDPKHESKLTDLLSKTTRMPIREVTDGMTVCPDQVYVIPPNTNLVIVQGNLRLAPRGEGRAQHLTVDHFFKSLAEDSQAGAIGVVLSGTGSDGARGLEEIKAAGGITFAQDEATARFAGMPQSAARSGCVDFVLSPAEIARELARIGRRPFVAPTWTADPGSAAVTEEDSFRKILALLRVTAGVDFTWYRDTTIKRRITRRMVLHTRESLADYSRLLEHNPEEVEALYNDLLINVTSFFRDPETFEVLKQRVFPEILKGKTSSTPLRIWVPGCSTGQEAYSLAIALLEHLDNNLRPPPIQIFATDLSDTMSLQKAREGLYPETIESEVSTERLRRFFTQEDGKYRISKSIRSLCVFAKQNVAGDPPFSRVDLISCRNLLIYLAPALQKRVIPTFHYALNPIGFLLLGAAESVGPFTDLFDVVDFSHRLYVKKEPAMRQYPHFSNYQCPTAAGIPGVLAPTVTAADWQREADRTLLGLYAPAGVLVNNNLDILQFRGRTGPYLEPAPGEPSHNLLRMAREGLLEELRVGIDECRRQNSTVRRAGVRLQENGQVREIDLRIIPIKLPAVSEGCFLILFEEGPARKEEAGRVRDETSQDRSSFLLPGWLRRWFGRTPASAVASPEGAATELNQELASTRDYLHCVIEEKDAANEELKSANEEIQSSNEELQSTNEELTTAKEELQSVNEELTTINEQLQHRNLGLNRLNDDLANLLNSANVPIVILGNDLCIRRFTPVAGKVLNLLPTDVNRPISHITSTLDLDDLEQLLLEVIETVQVREREVQDRDGRWHTLKIHPYRTADNKIDGAVMVLLDIHQAKITQDELGKRVEERTAELAQANEALKAEIVAHKQVEAARMELLQQLITAQEGERLRLARELHDQMGQHLTAISLGLKVVEGAIPETSAACNRLHQLQELTDLIGKEVHHLALELRPTALDDLGLNTTLVNYVESWSERSGVEVDFHSTGLDEERLPAALETALYRIVQEGLTNVLKHAGAHRVSLILTRSSNHVRAILEDDGCGFDPEKEMDGTRGSGRLGLLGMRERVSLVGGTLTIESTPGKGTAIFVSIPLPADRKEDSQ